MKLTTETAHSDAQYMMCYAEHKPRLLHIGRRIMNCTTMLTQCRTPFETFSTCDASMFLLVQVYTTDVVGHSVLAVKDSCTHWALDSSTYDSLAQYPAQRHALSRQTHQVRLLY